MTRFYKNWTFHNLVSHPLSEVVYWLCRPFGKNRATEIAGWVHDASVPEHGAENGRG